MKEQHGCVSVGEGGVQHSRDRQAQRPVQQGLTHWVVIMSHANNLFNVSVGGLCK